MPPTGQRKRAATSVGPSSPGESSLLNSSAATEDSPRDSVTRKKRRVIGSAARQSPTNNIIDIGYSELQALTSEINNGSLDLKQLKLKEEKAAAEKAAAEKAAKEEAERKEKRKNWTRLAAFQCAICMDSATNLTVTHCGHMFCMECLLGALNVEAERNRCPMCRQVVDNRDRNNWTSRTKGYWPLEIKLKMRPRKEPSSTPSTQNSASSSNALHSQPVPGSSSR